MMPLHTWNTCKGHMPERIDVDGIHNENRSTVYIGDAVRMPDGRYRCLANVNGCLCRVEVSIELLRT
jgi:hypothetical protein